MYCAFSLASAWPHTPPNQPEPPALSDTLAFVPTGERTKRPDYQRSQFGDGWAAQGNCTTRHAILAEQLHGNLSPDCRLATGHGIDPYGGDELTAASAIEIDHVFPLSAAWDLGAHAWSTEKRIQFANDPLNLVATSRAQNQEKSDSLPADWLPKNRASRCWYVRRLAVVAATYELPLPAADRAQMHRVCWVSELAGKPIG